MSLFIFNLIPLGFIIQDCIIYKGLYNSPLTYYVFQRHAVMFGLNVHWVFKVVKWKSFCVQ